VSLFLKEKPLAQRDEPAAAAAEPESVPAP
jgi:hypothetical protein